MCAVRLPRFSICDYALSLSRLEKFCLAKCYKYLEKFTAALDALYDSGVGEVPCLTGKIQ